MQTVGDRPAWHPLRLSMLDTGEWKVGRASKGTGQLLSGEAPAATKSEEQTERCVPPPRATSHRRNRLEPVCVLAPRHSSRITSPSSPIAPCPCRSFPNPLGSIAMYCSPLHIDLQTRRAVTSTGRLRNGAMRLIALSIYSR